MGNKLTSCELHPDFWLQTSQELSLTRSEAGRMAADSREERRQLSLSWEPLRRKLKLLQNCSPEQRAEQRAMVETVATSRTTVL